MMKYQMHKNVSEVKRLFENFSISRTYFVLNIFKTKVFKKLLVELGKFQMGKNNFFMGNDFLKILQLVV